MGQIHLLDKDVSELIAAGEVIERPASIVKELLENSIDAGATAITIEIKGGGIRFIRITDNGCGFEKEDVPIAFLRHATSKVSGKEDLEQIMTLGFRGEALASIAAVSRVELMSKTACEEYGTRIVVQGGETLSLEEAGCPNGTTMIVRDLFYNVPARLKFLKKDFSEANAVQAIVEKLAISHPEISFRMIKENKTTLHTAGDNRLISVIHAILGKDFANSLIGVDYQYQDIMVSGYISKPRFCRSNRAMQHFFVNDRYVKSKTCMAAIEEGYKNSIMVSKFPACVLKLGVDFKKVDVNVHPAKTEIRFTEEKSVFEAVYFAVKTALAEADILKTEVNQNKTFLGKSFEQPPSGTQLPIQRQNYFQKMTAQEFQKKQGSLKNSSVFDHFHSERKDQSSPEIQAEEKHKSESLEYSEIVDKINCLIGTGVESSRAKSSDPDASPLLSCRAFSHSEQMPDHIENTAISTERHDILQEEQAQPEIPEASEEAAETAEISVTLVGEIFKTYILCQAEDLFILLDKHAAHERILFEKLKTELLLKESQLLLTPVKIVLSAEECDLIQSRQADFEAYGFRFQFERQNQIQILEAPLILHQYDLTEIIQDMAQSAAFSKEDLTPVEFEELLHSIACRSAIKAGAENTPEELEALVKEVYRDNRIRHCPHGRPVAITMTRYEIEKKFGRRG